MKLVEIQNDNGRTYAKIRDQDVALVSLFAWRWRNGEAITNLFDVHGLTVTIDFLINNPQIVYGSHGVN